MRIDESPGGVPKSHAKKDTIIQKGVRNEIVLPTWGVIFTFIPKLTPIVKKGPNRIVWNATFSHHFQRSTHANTTIKGTK